MNALPGGVQDSKQTEATAIPKPPNQGNLVLNRGAGIFMAVVLDYRKYFTSPIFLLTPTLRIHFPRAPRGQIHLAILDPIVPDTIAVDRAMWIEKGVSEIHFIPLASNTTRRLGEGIEGADPHPLAGLRGKRAIQIELATSVWNGRRRSQTFNRACKLGFYFSPKSIASSGIRSPFFGKLLGGFTADFIGHGLGFRITCAWIRDHPNHLGTVPKPITALLGSKATPCLIWHHIEVGGLLITAVFSANGALTDHHFTVGDMPTDAEIDHPTDVNSTNTWDVLAVGIDG